MIRPTPESTEEAEVIAANKLVRYKLKWVIGTLSNLVVPFSRSKIYCDKNAVDSE